MKQDRGTKKTYNQRRKKTTVAKDKAPAYQRYPKDYLGDENVAVMSLEEEGAYNRLMDHCWLEGSIPADVRKLAALCKNVSTKRMQAMWLSIAPCFAPHPTQPGRLVHPRLEKERAKQKEWIEHQAESGRKGAEKRWGKHGDPNSDPSRGATSTPMAKNSFASASASSNKKDLTDGAHAPEKIGSIVARIAPAVNS